MGAKELWQLKLLLKSLEAYSCCLMRAVTGTKDVQNQETLTGISKYKLKKYGTAIDDDPIQARFRYLSDNVDDPWKILGFVNDEDDIIEGEDVFGQNSDNDVEDDELDQDEMDLNQEGITLKQNKKVDDLNPSPEALAMPPNISKKTVDSSPKPDFHANKIHNSGLTEDIKRRTDSRLSSLSKQEENSIGNRSPESEELDKNRKPKKKRQTIDGEEEEEEDEDEEEEE